MGKELSPHEKFKLERDEKIIARFKELYGDGTRRSVAYRIVASEMYPPITETAVLRTCQRYGIPEEPAKHGRKRKEVELAD